MHLSKSSLSHKPSVPGATHAYAFVKTPTHLVSPRSRANQIARSSSLRELFIDARVPERDLDRAVSIWSELDSVQVTRAEKVLKILIDLGLEEKEIGKVLLRYPQVFSKDDGRVKDVISFLQGKDLNLSPSQTRDLVVRFPQLFSYCVKAHLRPQLFYLTSLGVSNLQELVMERPLVLGEGIETVIKFLRMCGVPRKEMFRLIRSYPLDFNLKIKYVKEEAPPPQQPPK